MKSLSDLEYVELYAKKLKQDNRYFKQQKMLIDSQIIASRSLFRAMSAGSNFKQKAREYLKSVGLLRTKNASKLESLLPS